MSSQVLSSFSAACGKQIPYELVDRRAGDVDCIYAECTKAREILKWQTQKSLDEMCKDTWRWQSKFPHGFQTENNNIYSTPSNQWLTPNTCFLLVLNVNVDFIVHWSLLLFVLFMWVEQINQDTDRLITAGDKVRTVKACRMWRTKYFTCFTCFSSLRAIDLVCTLVFLSPPSLSPSHEYHPPSASSLLIPFSCFSTLTLTIAHKKVLSPLH